MHLHVTSIYLPLPSFSTQAFSTILTHFSQRYPRVPAGLGLDSEDEAGQEASAEDKNGAAQDAQPQSCRSKQHGYALQDREKEGEEEDGHAAKAMSGCVAGLSGKKDGRAANAMSGCDAEVGGCGGCDAKAAGGAVQRGQVAEQGCEADVDSCAECSEEGSDSEGACGGCKGAATNSHAGQGGGEQQQRGQGHHVADCNLMHSHERQPQQQQQQGMRTAPVMMAFDGMLVPMSVLPSLPAVGPVVAKLLKRVELLQYEQEQLLAQGV